SLNPRLNYAVNITDSLTPQPLSFHLPPLFFFFILPATTEIYTLSLHDALPILRRGARERPAGPGCCDLLVVLQCRAPPPRRDERSEEHTSELQSRFDLVCRLPLEKKKNQGLASTARAAHAPPATRLLPTPQPAR